MLQSFWLSLVKIYQYKVSSLINLDYQLVFNYKSSKAVFNKGQNLFSGDFKWESHKIWEYLINVHDLSPVIKKSIEIYTFEIYDLPYNYLR